MPDRIVDSRQVEVSVRYLDKPFALLEHGSEMGTYLEKLIQGHHEIL